MEKNKCCCPKCCKVIDIKDLLIGIGGCVYCPENSPFIKNE